jgi:hypothetical protein
MVQLQLTCGRERFATRSCWGWFGDTERIQKAIASINGGAQGHAVDVLAEAAGESDRCGGKAVAQKHYHQPPCFSTGLANEVRPKGLRVNSGNHDSTAAGSTKEQSQYRWHLDHPAI